MSETSPITEQANPETELARDRCSPEDLPQDALQTIPRTEPMVQVSEQINAKLENLSVGAGRTQVAGSLRGVDDEDELRHTLEKLKESNFGDMEDKVFRVLRVIADRLSEEEIGGLKELFKMIDTDNSGTITFDELKDGLRRVGSELMESEIKDLMDAADIDNSGTIDYGEFLAATVHLNKLEREENLVSAFSFFDKDSSGYITIDELQQACKEFGLSELHLDEMIKEIDQDNDGQIDYGEFAAMMRKGNGGIGRRTMRSTFSLGDALGLTANGSQTSD